MKKLPLLTCSLLGLLLLPWHLILPERSPYRDPYKEPSDTILQYRKDLAAQGAKDDRDDYFVVQELGRKFTKEGLEAQMWKQDSDFMNAYKNIEWANRERSYYVALLYNIYGGSSATLLKSKAWVVPVLLAFVYAGLYSIVAIFTPRKKKDLPL